MNVGVLVSISTSVSVTGFGVNCQCAGPVSKATTPWAITSACPVAGDAGSAVAPTGWWMNSASSERRSGSCGGAGVHDAGT